jgi:hypothetical protein
MARAGAEVVRDGERGRGGDERLFGMLAEPLEQHVATEGGTERGEFRVGSARRERPCDEIEIGGVAGVIEARPAIRKHPQNAFRVARAGAEVDRRRGMSVPRDGGEDALHVHRLRAPLEPVQQHEMQMARGRVEVIEHELIAVRQLDGLAAQRHQPPRADQAAPDRLKVRAGQEPGGRKVCGHGVARF